jgi:DNA-binding transcriptional regulator GbsR (MarR family)
MDPLNAQQQIYVEDMGLFFEEYGSQRSIGKVIGVLLLVEDPLSQEDLMRLLSLSRTSTSTALQWATEHLGFVERVSLPGDRKRYYHIRSEITEWLARSNYQRLADLQRLLVTAERLAGPRARARLAPMREFISFLTQRIEAALAEWEQTHLQPGAHGGG